MDTFKNLRIKDNEFKMLSCDFELKRGIIYALECLYGNDHYLIDNGVGSHVDERAIVFRFGYYFQTFLEHLRPYSDYVVDVEYNRDGSISKRVNGDLKIPDLILHKRGTKDNLLVMEFKTYWNVNNEHEVKEDINELKEITKQIGAYKYRYGLFIVINKDKPLVTVFKNGDYYSGVNERSYFDNKI